MELTTTLSAEPRTETAPQPQVAPSPSPHAELLDALFTYHPPTAAQKPLYTRLSDAYHDVGALLDCYADPRARDQSVYKAVGGSLRRLAEVILECCPDCPDRDAAIRCVRLARNGINAHLYAGVHSTQRELEIARAELLKARWQAASAIALDGRA